LEEADIETLPAIGPDSAFVRAAMDAGAPRRTLVQAGGRTANAADTCTFDPQQISTIANVLFWASIRVEEGRPVHGLICVASPDESPFALAFASPVDVSIDSVVQFMTAAPHSALAVHTGASGAAEIWGLVDRPPRHALQLRIARPGTVVASVHTQVVAVMHDGQVSVPKEASDLSWMSFVARAFGTELPLSVRLQKAARLLRIVAAMLKHGHGGTLVVVPSASAAWRAHVSIRHAFAGSQGSNLLKEQLAQLEAAHKEADDLEMALVSNQATDVPRIEIRLKLQAAELHAQLVNTSLARIGALSALDGALLLDDELSVLGFGAKLQAHPDDFALALVNALDGSIRKAVPLDEIGGTRHQSAARFIKSHHDALAFVASQDGRLTLFAWVITEAAVAGLTGLEHLLWEFDAGT
jgi:hypothetical protein